MNLKYNNSDFIDLPLDWEDFKAVYHQVYAITYYQDFAMDVD